MRFVILILSFAMFTSVKSQQIFDNLKASQIGDSILIQWTLLADYTCNDMLLQRSANDGCFKTIFSISGICGATENITYQYLDGSNLQSAQNYNYRISASTDFYISDTAKIIFNSTGNRDFVVFPNPASTDFTISINNNLRIPLHAEILSLDGKILWQNV
ncbi:MAG TPA: hypothetical protein VFM99_01085, partial [Chitinophagales bacterium]|nr:hypothetical protein [Chitinophagales bacterium]